MTEKDRAEPGDGEAAFTLDLGSDTTTKKRERKRSGKRGNRRRRCLQQIFEQNLVPARGSGSTNSRPLPPDQGHRSAVTGTRGFLIEKGEAGAMENKGVVYVGMDLGTFKTSVASSIGVRDVIGSGCRLAKRDHVARSVARPRRCLWQGRRRGHRLALHTSSGPSRRGLPEVQQPQRDGSVARQGRKTPGGGRAACRARGRADAPAKGGRHLRRDRRAFEGEHRQ